MIKKYYGNSYVIWYVVQLLVLISIIFILGFKYTLALLLFLIICTFLYHFIFNNIYPDEISKPLFKRLVTPFIKPKENYFIIGFDKDYVYLKNYKLLKKNIKSYHTSKGGSEPFLYTLDNIKIDVKLSWLKKEERKEVEELLLKAINETR